MSATDRRRVPGRTYTRLPRWVCGQRWWWGWRGWIRREWSRGRWRAGWGTIPTRHKKKQKLLSRGEETWHRHHGDCSATGRWDTLCLLLHFTVIYMGIHFIFIIYKCFCETQFLRQQEWHVSYCCFSDMTGPLLWLQNCLNKTADDREEDGKYMYNWSVRF